MTGFTEAMVPESAGDPHRRPAEGRIAFTWRLTADQGEETVLYDFLSRRLVAGKHPRQAHQRTRRAPRRPTSARRRDAMPVYRPYDGCQARRAARLTRPKRRTAAAGGSERGQ